MIPELGQYALILALGLALIQIIFIVHGLIKQDIPFLASVRVMSLGQFLLVGISFAALTYALIFNDFSVAYVAENSNRQLPVIYRFCALWGAHEGSMLLWVFILCIWGLAAAFLTRHITDTFRAQVLLIICLIAVGFYIFILLTSNPFVRILPMFPENGRDLNPILQDPGLVIHPPTLYMGYVGFAITFAFALAGLISGEVNREWAKKMMPWAIAAWCFLTLGIVLGSAWAYRELGWGGWWFWDPVENASFLPWLAGTALIHSLIVSEKRALFFTWTIFLAICTFSLSLLGTFLVRSGVLVSVHSFASDPKRGIYMLIFLMLVIGGALSLFAWRGLQDRHQSKAPIYFSAYSRETMLLANNVLLFVAMLTVLLGTLYPLFIDSLHLQKISVGAPYFNLVFIPMMIPLVLLTAIAPTTHWQQTIDAELTKRCLIILFISLLAALCLPTIIGMDFKIKVSLGLLMVFWLIGHLIWHGLLENLISKKTFLSWKRRNWAMLLAHTGLAVTALGIILSTAYSQEQDLRMQPGSHATLGPYQFEFITTTALPLVANYYGTQAQINVYYRHHLIKTLYPEQRIFPISQMETSKAAIDAGIFRDLYVALGSKLPDDPAWSVRIYYKPFIRWIWAGGIMMVLGGIIAWFNRLKMNPLFQRT